MIRAVFRNGAIEPIDPIPNQWTDGETLQIEATRNGAPQISEFKELADCWKSETQFISSTTEIATHPAYQRIIGMGNEVVPLILRELKNDQCQWFWALQAITGHDPVVAEDRGNVAKMTEAWLGWGRDKGLIDDE